MANIIMSRQLYTLERPVWFDAARLSKGIDHDRQHLGIILAAGDNFRIRQKTATPRAVTLRLLNDDRTMESSVTVGTSWVSVTAKVASVPFIDTPFDTAAPVVEFEYADTAKMLPVFTPGDRESEFFALWDNQNAEFALITMQYVNIFVPAVDKQKLRTLYPQDPVANLIDVYDDIFTYYNNMIGISFNTATVTDRNIPNRYFIKADKNGAGAAYYGVSWTASNASSIANIWLDLKDQWGSLHEIAHGYEGLFTTDSYTSVSEVWNNIYCASYQNDRLGDRQYTEGWLYNYGKQAEVERTISNYISAGSGLNKWDLRSKLFFYMQMIFKTGVGCFTRFNQQYRHSANASGFVPGDHALLDMLSESFMTGEQGANVTPYMQLVGAPITGKQSAVNLFSEKKAVYPLNQLVSDSQLSAVQSKLDLQSAFMLVDSQQLKSTGITADVTLSLDVDDFDQIRDASLQLLDGTEILRQVTVSTKQVVLNQLPIGVYTLRLPTGRSKKYLPDTDYMVVKSASAHVQINYVRRTASSILTQSLNLLGLGDSHFGSVTVDYDKASVAVKITNKRPHSYFANVTYVEVIVRSQDNAVRYHKVVPGTDAVLCDDEIAFTLGDTIEVIHQEPSRLQLKPAFEGVIDRSNKSNVFEITATGLKNTRLNNNPQDGLLERIALAAAEIMNHEALVRADYASLKDDLYLALLPLDAVTQQALKNKYSLALPAHNTVPDFPVDPIDPVEPDAPYPAWSPTKVYNTYGEKVTYKRKVYSQNYYSVNKAPDTHSAPWGEPWVYLNDY